MKQNRRHWAVLALALVLLLGVLVRMERNRQALRAACAYLESRKYDEADPSAPQPASIDPMKTDPGGKVTAMQINSNHNIDLLFSLIGRAEGVRRVSEIPELSRPRVSCGEYLRGNWEKLYYTDPDARRITEFTLTRADSMTLALCLVPFGPTYPEIQEYYVAELTEYLQARMPPQGEDQFQLTEDGRLDSVNIRTQETLERYLDCVRSCDSIQDQTDRICGIWALPPTVRVAGRDTCNCEYVTYTSPSTGRPIAFCLRREDSQAFLDYLTERAGARPQTAY